MKTESSVSIRRVFRTRKLEHRLNYGSNGLFAGVWLGLLDREALYEIDKMYHDRDTSYETKDYNTQGLWKWEKDDVSTHIDGYSTILVAGAGGGEELTQGAKVTGFADVPFPQDAPDLTGS